MSRSMFADHRIIRRCYRKRLLPKVQKCLLGLAAPEAAHHSRLCLDNQSVSEILACFDGDTWVNNLTPDELRSMWEDWLREKPHQVSIGKFVEHLYDQQVLHDCRRIDNNDDPTVTVAGLHEKRMALMATLFIAGYLPEFRPESILELT